MRRRLRVALVGVVVLLVLAALTVQIVLRTDVPRRIVEDVLRDATGLEVVIDELDAGWLGRATARGIAVAHPLQDAPVLRIPEIDVAHANLIRLAITRSVDMERLTAIDAVLTLREDPEGRWNIADVVAALRAAGGGGASPASARDLPEVDLRGLTVEVVRASGASFSYRDVRLHGAPTSTQAWAFEVTRAPEVAITGRVLPVSMRHEVSFVLDGLEPLLRPYLGDAAGTPEGGTPETTAGSTTDTGTGPAEIPLPRRIAGAWSGRVTDDGLAGRLRIDQATAGPHELLGAIDVRAGVNGLTLAPDEVVFRSRALGDEPVHIRSGRAVVTTEEIRVDQVIADGYGARARIDGTWSTERHRGAATVVWSGVGVAPGLIWPARHGGTLEVSFAAPPIGATEIDLQASLEAEGAAGNLDATLIVSGRGPDWRRLAGRVRFPSLSWRDEHGMVNMDGAALALDVRDRQVHVTELAVPGPATLAATALLDAQASTWTLRLEATDWTIPRTVDRPLDLNIDAHGTFERVDFTRLDVSGPGVELRASGRYVSAEAEPLVADARLRVEHAFGSSAAPAGAAPAAATGSGPAGDPPAPPTILDAEVTVRGAVEPLELTCDGRVTIRDLRAGRRVVDEIVMPWRAVFDARHATFRGDDFPLLGGTWTLDGDLAYAATAGGSPPDLALRLVGRRTPLAELITIIDLPLEMDGVVGAEVEVRVPDLDLDRLEADGSWNVIDLASDRFTAGRGLGRIGLRQRRLELGDIRLERGDGWIEGAATLDLTRRNDLRLDLTTRRWPVSLPNTTYLGAIDATGSLAVDLSAGTARGRLDVLGTVTDGEDEIGAVTALVEVKDRLIRLDGLRASVLGGTIDASGSVTAGQWLTARGRGTWDRLDLSRLGEHVPALVGASGLSSGSFTIVEADAPHEPGPVRIEATGRTEGGVIHDALALGGFSLLAHVEPDRILLDRGAIDVGGGTLGLWGRLSRHGALRHVHGIASFDAIAIEQVLHAIQPDLGPVPGRIDGRLSATTYLGGLDRTYGTGELRLSRSDLGRLPGFDLLYDLLRVQLDPAESEGFGVVELTLEGERLVIPRMEYFNRGTDVAGSLTVEDLTKGVASPIEGYAVGAARPFRDIDLSLFNELDRLIGAIQADTVAVKISGTVEDRQVREVLLEEIGLTLKRILGVR